MMNYDNIVNDLKNMFPQFKRIIADDEYLSDLPHCILDMFFVPFVYELCKEKNNNELEKVACFIEEMELSNDNKIVELLNVSFLEPLILSVDKEQLNYLKSFFKEKTLKDIQYWIEKYKT